jgi:uncharacterized protein YjbJ (UPF0337 family)
MSFLLQNTTNRESNAILVKLDELIQATSCAREDVMGIEKRQVSDQEAINDQLPPATPHKPRRFSQAGPGERCQCVGRFPRAARKGLPRSRSGQTTDPAITRKVSMTEKKNTGPEEGVKGVVEDVKGKAKEAVGTVTGRDDLVREGKAQQDKADAQRDVAKKEAQAESSRAGAKAAEKRQEAEQRP